eukprot:TRINITY_DN1270_c0_g2_i1.p1 TRINITY_DN1270_c0_g2~~TRINITY_DN1270_c0_g2_i1.p1  ORF type:complete len:749 (+),score=165.07 TRINITY_DN1270_c0_g2_i1:323-2569(+)
MERRTHQFYVGDIVCLAAKNHCVGVVSRVAWMPDSDDEHWEYFSGFEEEHEEALKDDHVEVLWNSNMKVSQVPVNKIRVVDRGLVHGDVVASCDDPSGPICTVVDVVMSVDLMMVKSGQRIQNVFPKYLTDIHPFMIGRHVTRKQPPKLVGTIDDVLCDVEVKFPDRSHCIIHGATPSTLKAMEDDVSEDEVEPERNYLYYPSQQVGVTQTVLDAAEWIIKPKANKNQRQKKTKQRVCGTVMKVTPVCVVVYWHNKKIEEEVDEKCSPDDLIVLNHFKHTKFEVGDYTMIHPQVRNYFLAFAKDGKPTPNQANTKAKSGGKGKRKEKRQDENEENDEEQDSLSLQISSTVSNHEELMSFTEGWTGSDGECAVITGTHTHVRVRWQDGRTEELWRPSTQFVPRKYLLNYEFGPGRFVHEEDRSELGIIKKVNQKEKTAVIQWTNQTGEIEEQEISVYDLEERPDKKFRLGGVVQSSKGDKVGEVVEVNGNEITVAWSTSEVEKAQYDDLQAIDTDEEDEGTEEEGQPSEVVEKDIVFEDYKEEEEADKHKQEQPTKCHSCFHFYPIPFLCKRQISNPAQIWLKTKSCPRPMPISIQNRSSISNPVQIWLKTRPHPHVFHSKSVFIPWSNGPMVQIQTKPYSHSSHIFLSSVFCSTGRLYSSSLPHPRTSTQTHQNCQSRVETFRRRITSRHPRDWLHKQNASFESLDPGSYQHHLQQHLFSFRHCLTQRLSSLSSESLFSFSLQRKSES